MTDLLEILHARRISLAGEGNKDAAAGFVPLRDADDRAELAHLADAGLLSTLHFDFKNSPTHVQLIDPAIDTEPDTVFIELARCPACGSAESKTIKTARVLAPDGELIGRRKTMACATCGKKFFINEG